MKKFKHLKSMNENFISENISNKLDFDFEILLTPDEKIELEKLYPKNSFIIQCEENLIYIPSDYSSFEIFEMSLDEYIDEELGIDGKDFFDMYKKFEFVSHNNYKEMKDQLEEELDFKVLNIYIGNE
ncbi:MAG: hypothetical protein ACOCP8_05780 [archaeon]